MFLLIVAVKFLAVFMVLLSLVLAGVSFAVFVVLVFLWVMESAVITLMVPVGGSWNTSA